VKTIVIKFRRLRSIAVLLSTIHPLLNPQIHKPVKNPENDGRDPPVAITFSFAAAPHLLDPFIRISVSTN